MVIVENSRERKRHWMWCNLPQDYNKAAGTYA